MAFLSLGIEKSFLTLEKSGLEYEMMMYENEYNEITEEINDYYSEECDDEDALAYLQNQQEYYDSKKEGIESQLTLINNEIESYDKVIGENIKKSCKLSFSA